MDNCNIGTAIKRNVSFLWSLINQQPTEIFLGAIVGWTAFWIPFIMERVAVVYVLADLASVCMLCNFAANFKWLLNFLTPPIADLFLGTTVGWFVGWSLFHIGKIPFMYPLVMVIAILLSIFLIWYLGDFIWEKIKELIIFLITLILGVCAILLSILLVFGKAVLIFLVVMAVVALGSLVMIYGFDKIKSMISNVIFDKLWSFFIFSIGTFFLSGCVVWGPILMSLLIGKSFLFYLASVAVAFLNMNIFGRSSGEEIDLDGLPPPSTELLPDSRPQEVNSQFNSAQGQASQEITVGTGHIQDENRSVGEQPQTAPSTFKLVPVRTEQEQPPPPEANPAGPGHLKPSLDQTDHQILQSVNDPATCIQNMTNMNIVRPNYGEEIDLDGLPFPFPKLLSDSKQQGVDSQFDSAQGQASQEITLGTGHIQDENRSVVEQPPTAPSTFKLVSVRTEQEEPPPPVANPTGPSHLKASLDQIDRQSVDDHAIQVSAYDHPSFRDLVWDLIFSKNISNELEKVRAIFLWLATKNFKEIIFDNVEKGSPEEVLIGLKEGKTTYAEVFATMCNYTGLHSRIIRGYAKWVDYNPGIKFIQDTDKHSWNAVYINGTWGLVDANWGARGVIKKFRKLHYRLNEYYFLPDPYHFICDHLPDDDQWQLLERPMTLEEFENMPHIKPCFFIYGLEFVSHHSVIIHGRGEMNVRLRYSSNKLSGDFDFCLEFYSGEEEYKGTKLNRFGMVESIAGIASFRLRLPIKGSYILSIYVKEYISENNVNLKNVCEYKVVQEEVSVTEPPPFPPCTYLNWGPNTYFYRYGLATNQQTAQISTKDGKAELQIIIPQQMEFMTKLKHSDRNDADLEGYVTHRIVENNVYFNITAPSRGEYGLEIYANDPSTEGSTMYHVAQYLVDFNEDVKTVSLPKLAAGYLGAKPKFNDYGMNTLSHQNPVIDLEANTVEIQFSVAQEVRVGADLIEVETNRKMPEFVFIQTKDSVISLIVNCPSAGFYKLQLYALPVHDPSIQLQGVYNYLINCQTKTENVYPFPIQYTKWTKGCYMWEPLVVHKEIGKPTVNFHVKIPKAENVAVEINQKWTYLQSSQPEIWQGEVNLAPYYGEGVKVTVNANFGGDKTNYSTLLEYSV